MRGRWCYLYPAVDFAGATIDFLLSALRDAETAERRFRQALSPRPIASRASSTRIWDRSTTRRLLT
jgi:transposase-like protein